MLEGSRDLLGGFGAHEFTFEELVWSISNLISLHESALHFVYNSPIPILSSFLLNLHDSHQILHANRIFYLIDPILRACPETT